MTVCAADSASAPLAGTGDSGAVPSVSVATPSQPVAGARQPAATKTAVLAAIKTFDAGAVGGLAGQKQPAADPAAAVAAASATMLNYALTSEDVVIDLGPEAVPWCDIKKGLGDAANPGVRGLLFGAYLAGEIKAQLHAGRADANPYPGWVHMFRVYRSVKTREGIQIPEIEAIMAHQTDGTLTAFAAETEKRALEHLRKAYGEAGEPGRSPAGPGSLASDRQN
jgi:hypothetical protein